MQPTDTATLVSTALHDPDFRRARAAARQLAQTGADLPAALDALTAGLRHADAFVRRRAAPALAGLGEQAAPAAVALLAALEDASWTVREAVVLALAEVPADAGGALAERALHDRSPLVREAAVRTAIRRGADAVRDFGPATKHPHASVRRRALQALALFPPGTAGVVPLLRAALEDSHVKVRLTAAATLGGCGTAAVAVIPRLARCAFEGDTRVRLAAADALRRLLEEAAAPLRWLTQTAGAAEALRVGLARPDLPPRVRQEFVAACVRRQQWHRRRRADPAGQDTPPASAWDAAVAAVEAAHNGEAELAWLLGWLCELWLREGKGMAP